MKTIFTPKIKTLGFFQPDKVFSFKELKDETMFFSCDPNFVRKHIKQAPITNWILDQLSMLIGFANVPLFHHLVIDTRVNMLMPGHYPSIPGWHCDDVKRHEKYSQPDFSQCSDDVQHFMVLISDTKDPRNCISGTEFVTDEREYDVNPDKVWQSLHEGVELDSNKKTRFIKEREIIQFNQAAIHRASPAKTNGWRLFFRLSITHRKPVNEIRNHVQSYVDPNNAGW